MIGNAKTSAFRRRLQSLQRHLDHEHLQLHNEAQAPIGGEASGGLSNVPLHAADLASREIEEDVTLRMLANEEHIGDEIAAALERLDRGLFGRCESCGQAVAEERLRAIPYTRFCVRCAEQKQAQAAP